MILLDYSQVALSTIFQFSNDLKKSDDNEKQVVNIVRHAVLTGLKAYKKKFAREYGEVILACDSHNYWRKEIFPQYKANRKPLREKSDLDWDLIFKTIGGIRDDVAEHFPYKVLHVDRAEADDIIGVMCKWTQTNGFEDHGMFEEKQPVMIVSSDGDFKQLHKYDNIKQFSPMMKKNVICEETWVDPKTKKKKKRSISPEQYLLMHIAKAGDDGIPNVLSADDVFVTAGARQTPMKAARLEEFGKDGSAACRTLEEQKNWDRNNRLINLDLIPTQIEQAVIDAYINQKPRGTKMDIYNYLVKNGCRMLLNEIEEF